METVCVDFASLKTDMAVLYDAESGYYDGNDAIYFKLNDTIYVAVADPDDGYRSSLNGVYIVDNYNFTNKIDSRVVAVLHYPNDPAELVLMEFFSDKKIIEIGTDYSDSYYPWVILELNLQ